MALVAFFNFSETALDGAFQEISIASFTKDGTCLISLSCSALSQLLVKAHEARENLSTFPLHRQFDFDDSVGCVAFQPAEKVSCRKISVGLFVYS